MYISELSKGYLSNIDNIKLIKQINNCFNDSSFNNACFLTKIDNTNLNHSNVLNIGPVVMTTNIGNSTSHSTGSTKHK